MPAIILLASPAPGGAVSFGGYWSFLGALGTFVPATDYQPPRVSPVFEAGVVANVDQVRTKTVLQQLLGRLETEMLALVARTASWGVQPYFQSGLLSWTPVPRVRRVGGMPAGLFTVPTTNEGVPFSNVGLETSPNVQWLGNAADADAVIVSSRQRGPLLGLHGAALVLNLDVLTSDAALTAAALKVLHAVDAAAYP